MSAFSAIGDDREIDRDEFTPGIEPQATWCPGCGDFGVLKALKQAMPEVGRNPDEVALFTGIGCSGKLNSYFNSYGFHTIHGRLSQSLNAGATYIARTAAVNPNQAKEIIAEAIEHDGFAHIDFLTQCPTWNKDAKHYVPYTDVQQSDEFDFDLSDRAEAAEMMRKTEERLYEGEVLTGRMYVEDERPSYGAEKRAIGEMPEEPLAERYFDEDAEWERTYDNLLEHHK